MRQAAEGLAGLGQSALNNASEQVDTSRAVGGGGGMAVSDAYALNVTTFERTRYSGVGGRGVDGYDVELVEMSDGTFIVSVHTSSGFEGNGSDVLSVAGLASPNATGAVASLMSALGGSFALFGVSRGGEIRFDNRADAETFMARIRERGDDWWGADGLRIAEVDEELARMGRDGVDARLLSVEVSRDGGSLQGEVGAGPLSLSADSAITATTHNTRYEGGVQVSDTLRAVDPSFSVKIGAAEFQAAVAREISIIRGADGRVIGMEVVDTVAPYAGAGFGSSDVSTIASAGSSRTPVLGSIQHLVSSSMSADVGSVVKTTRTYEFDGPAGRSLLEGQGISDPNRAMSAESIRSMASRLERGATGAQQIVEVYDSGRVSTGGRVISYESQTDQSHLSLVRRTAQHLRY